MNEYEFDFNAEFTTDEEVEEMLNNLVAIVGRQVRTDDNKNMAVNQYRVQHVLYTYKMLKYITRGTKARVEYKLHEPYKSMGYVSITGANLLFNKSDWFIKAVKLASNFEVYPKTDGTVQMNFTFHGLTKPIE